MRSRYPSRGHLNWKENDNTGGSTYHFGPLLVRLWLQYNRCQNIGHIFEFPISFV